MEKRNGAAKSPESANEKGTPYRNRLISLKLDEYMFQGPGSGGNSSLIRLFDVRKAKPEQKAIEKPVNIGLSNTTGLAGMSVSGYPQVHPRSFFDLTIFAYARRGTTMEEAVRAGELTRGITMPAVGVSLLPSAFGVGLLAGLYVGPTASAASAAAKKSIWKHSWKWVARAGAAAGTPTGQDILNHKLPWVMDELGFGDGKPGGLDVLKYLVKEFIDQNTPPPRPYVQPELWSNPRREKTTLILPPSPEEIEEFKKLLQQHGYRIPEH